ncbi:MAG: hypothetical protein FWG74_09400, partial [Planctomycetes bacterium]|nr:hypothetical protein [Planctomycetota bacterium]
RHGVLEQFGQDFHDTFLTFTQANFALGGTARNLQTLHIETVDKNRGLYRISSYQCKPSPGSDITIESRKWAQGAIAVERSMIGMSMLIGLGGPSAGQEPRPEPTVRDVKLDVMVRGWEAVPGEPNHIPKKIMHGLKQHLQPGVVESLTSAKVPPQSPQVLQAPQATEVQKWVNEGSDKLGVCEAAISMWLTGMMNGGNARDIPGDAKACENLQNAMIQNKANWVSHLAARQLAVNTLNDPNQRVFFDGSSTSYSTTTLKGGDDEARGFGWLRDNLSHNGGFAVLSASDPELVNVKDAAYGHAIGVFREGPDNFWVFDPNQGLYQTTGAGLDQFLSQCNRYWPRVEATLGQVSNLNQTPGVVSELMRNGSELAWMEMSKDNTTLKNMFYSGNHLVQQIQAGIKDRVLVAMGKDPTASALLQTAGAEARQGGVTPETGKQLQSMVQNLTKAELAKVWQDSSSAGEDINKRITMMAEILFPPKVEDPSRLNDSVFLSPKFASIGGKDSNKFEEFVKEAEGILKSKSPVFGTTGPELVSYGIEQGLKEMGRADPGGFGRLMANDSDPDNPGTALTQLRASLAILVKARIDEMYRTGEATNLLKQVAKEGKSISRETGRELQALAAFASSKILLDFWKQAVIAVGGADQQWNHLNSRVAYESTLWHQKTDLPQWESHWADIE